MKFLIDKNLYLKDEAEQFNPYAAPLLAPDLHGLPPALIITAECDPVQDGAEQYGRRLLEAGVPTTISRYEGMIHGFMHYMTSLPQAKNALVEVCQALQTAFASVAYE